MTEQERALELADSMRHGGFPIHQNVKDWRLAERGLRLLAATLAASLPPIEREGSREYIPLPGGWEIQTEENGSSYRLCDTKTGERLNILGGDGSMAQDFVTRMAKEVHAASRLAAQSVVTDEMVEAMTRRQFEMDWDGKYGEPSQPTERRWHLTKAAYRARVEAVLSDLGISPALKKEPTNV